MLPYPTKQKLNARRLRRDQTDVEAALWKHIRSRQIAGVKFRRQHPVGPYIVDFCSIEWRLIIELEGGQHSRREKGDLKRTAFLQRSGYRVLRFWNNEVSTNMQGVLSEILSALDKPLCSRDTESKIGVIRSHSE
ncbi:MAG TPA: endonuclease domain-containing protein [Candidatus Binatia bacterium]